MLATSSYPFNGTARGRLCSEVFNNNTTMINNRIGTNKNIETNSISAEVMEHNQHFDSDFNSVRNSIVVPSNLRIYKLIARRCLRLTLKT